MKDFTDTRDAGTCDEVWLLQHEPVYTQGQAGKPEHLLSDNGIPVVKSDRGGQITYHGPGQLIAYLLIDLRRRGLGVRQLVTLIEQAVIALLAEVGVTANTRDKAPGVYVNEQKIASLGLRVRKNCTYHGLSLNLDMDLAPFAGINVCGYQGLQVTRLSDLISEVDERKVRLDLIAHLVERLGYSEVEYVD
ncbi:Octanoate-[acyl-carrier-protein]-protein-N-octanoyltransferase [gamma proteobacterium IMCC2047]|nr:Octanoate-[acyl-carrier-protein]-protein-N-octanoyltransferase [gamma proteobacterium IMCC2047]